MKDKYVQKHIKNKESLINFIDDRVKRHQSIKNILPKIQDALLVKGKLPKWLT